MIETLEKQDGRPHVVLDPFRASAPANKTQAPLASPATALAGVCRVDCKSRARATESALLLQRLETLEAITTKLAQRLAILEQGSLPPSCATPPAVPHQPPPAMSRTLLKTRIRLTRAHRRDRQPRAARLRVSPQPAPRLPAKPWSRSRQQTGPEGW
jgi:hypothetical protein